MSIIISAKIPEELNKRLERDKRRRGVTKSDIVRQILYQHYQANAELHFGVGLTLKAGNGG